MEGLKAALKSEQIEKARLDMARENLEVNITAMRANLQQLSRELAYHRTAPENPALDGHQEQGPADEVIHHTMHVPIISHAVMRETELNIRRELAQVTGSTSSWAYLRLPLRSQLRGSRRHPASRDVYEAAAHCLEWRIRAQTRGAVLALHAGRGCAEDGAADGGQDPAPAGHHHAEPAPGGAELAHHPQPGAGAAQPVPSMDMALAISGFSILWPRGICSYEQGNPIEMLLLLGLSLQLADRGVTVLGKQAVAGFRASSLMVACRNWL